MSLLVEVIEFKSRTLRPQERGEYQRIKKRLLQDPRFGKPDFNSPGIGLDNRPEHQRDQSQGQGFCRPVITAYQQARNVAALF